MWSSPSISKPVATLVAIMQNASCGVRTLMACQLRFSTSTVAFVNMFIKFQTTTAHGRSGVCSLLIGHANPGHFFGFWVLGLGFISGCLARFCSESFGFRDRRAPDYATRQLKNPK